jgi:hypothetical protein
MLLLAMHKIARFTKQQKIFVIYLVLLTFFIVVLPIVRVTPTNPTLDSRAIFLLSGAFGTTAFVLLVSLIILLGRNTSFRFKALITTYFWFRDSDALLNFWFLWLITALYISIGDTISIFNETTTIQTTRGGYTFILLLLIVGLILTLVSVIKKAKTSNKGKVINIVSDKQQDDSLPQTVKWLFGGKEL